ncbi:MAG: HU family DNA-binding protein [Oscillospiraceae bacterium]|nr:HU family DNA-binding protein [Oscillospiraceae bacterium]
MQRPALSRALLYQKKYKRSSPMNKSELINAVAEKAALSKKDSEAAVTAALDAITAALAEGDEVRLVGFGTFEVKKREARIGRNPKTKEEIQIPATKIPSFKPGKALKDVVAK